MFENAQCANCGELLDSSQPYCPVCGSSSSKNRKGPFPKWLVFTFLFIAPFGTFGACTVLNWHRNEYGYDYLNTPMLIEVILIIAGIIMLSINMKVEWDNK